MNSSTSTHQAHPATEVKVTLPAENPRRKRDRVAKQEALLRAALRLFATKGYESTTTREIAASAGCAEGLIHRYFQGKAGLLAALVEYRISKEVGEMSHGVQPARSPQQEFLQLVDWEVERMWENRDFLRVFIPRAIVDPDLAAMMNHAVISVRAKAIRERLKQYPVWQKLPAGELEALAQSVGMLGLVFGFLRPLVLGHERVRAKEMAAVLAKVLVRGINCPA
ncbi:MAG: helix-turn-helix domain-containing protein [Terriglobales bacterium]